MKKVDISLVVCVAYDVKILNLLNSINYECEIVLVLNGVTTEVKNIIDEFKENSSLDIKIINIPDRNLSKARNIGTKNAKYNKVVFYDSDCLIVGDALSKYSKFLDKYLLVDGKVEFKKDTFQSKIVAIIRDMGLPGRALCPSIGINKKIINKVNGYYFDEDIKWVEDTELNRRALKSSVKIGCIKSLTCIHDNLTFRQDLKSAFRYGTGVKKSAKKGLHKKRPTANWKLIIPAFKKNILAGIYCIIWNIVYCFGYYFSN